MVDHRGVRCGAFVMLVVSALVLPSSTVRAQTKPKTSTKTKPATGGSVVPLCQTGCFTYAVTVTPDGAPVTDISNTTDTAYFSVENIGNTEDVYTLSCTSTGGVSCVSVTPASLDEIPLDDEQVTVVYTVGSTGGNLKLEASSFNGADDFGSYIVTSAVLAPPVIALRNYNGDNHDRAMCLTAGAGEAAGWECGDLVVTHGLPAYSTIGHSRALSLLYNSAQAIPMPAVAASVTEGGTIYPPNAVFARLTVNGVVRDSATYNTWSSSPVTRQVVLAFSDTTDSTGIYPFTLLVRNQYASSVKDTTLSGNLIVVNRSNSQFGAGWSLIGVEHLYLNQGSGRILWVDGDASAAEYDSIDANTWRAAAGDFRDTLTYDAGSTTYTRHLRHRVHVVFDAAGRHIQTINRTGQVATFYWTTASNRLDSIAVPPAKMATTLYKITYDGNGKLDKITDPAGRILDATVTSNRLLSLQDPDTKTTTFAYDGAGRMTSRTNRRSFITSYVYAKGFHVDTVKVPVGRTSTDTSTKAVTSFRPWDEQGLASGTTGQTAVDTGLAYTKIDEARTDVADTAEFWVDRWGAPIKSRDPLGNITTINRGDAKNPSAVTRVQYANGRILLATYDTLRANLLTMTDSTHQGSDTTAYHPVTTTYTYGETHVPDSPTKIATPVDTTQIAFDTALGVPTRFISQNGHRTGFFYFSSGNLKGILHQVVDSAVATAADTLHLWVDSTKNLTTSFEYDSLGNDTLAVTPLGGATRYRRDAFTRVLTTFDAANHRIDYGYDVLNQMDTVGRYDSTQAGVVAIYRTQYFHTANGAIDSVIDPRGVLRSWTFDNADRPITMLDDAGATATYFYDPAGLMDSTKTRAGLMIRHTYDAASRATKTAFPLATDSIHAINGSLYFVNLPGDSIRRTFDAMGQLLTATNSTGTVTRAYNLEGTLRAERQLASSSPTMDDTVHYWYDNGDRRTKFYNGTDTLSYSYGADGQLATLRMKWMTTGVPADSFMFSWDGLGRRKRVVYAAVADTVSYGYDGDGRLRFLCSLHSSTSSDLLNQVEFYSSVDKDGLTHAMSVSTGVINACTSTGGTFEESWSSGTYDQRHELLSRFKSPNTETYHYDASGNLTYSFTAPAGTDSFAVNSTNNRLQVHANHISVTWDTTTYSWDGNGNRIADYPLHTINRVGFREQFFNALGQMVGDSTYVSDAQHTGSISMCAYDGIGRRVRPCLGPLSLNVTDVMAFDGDNTVACCGDWRWANGPSLDDPLVGLFNNGGTMIKYYYITDGRGRFIVKVKGSDVSSGTTVSDYAGGIGNSNGFDNSRQQTADAPGLSFYRNRNYDQGTGRFLEEDPSGIAGGVNLYQYAGNNPIMSTDPFGLSPDTTLNCQDENGVELTKLECKQRAKRAAAAKDTTKSRASQQDATKNNPYYQRCEASSDALKDNLLQDLGLLTAFKSVLGGKVPVSVRARQLASAGALWAAGQYHSTGNSGSDWIPFYSSWEKSLTMYSNCNPD